MTALFMSHRRWIFADKIILKNWKENASDCCLPDRLNPVLDNEQ